MATVPTPPRPSGSARARSATISASIAWPPRSAKRLRADMDAAIGPPSTHRPRTIAFTSGKGGVGKSSLVLNMGLALAHRGQRLAILDGDFGAGSLNVLLGLSPRFDLRHVVAGERRLADTVVRGPHGIGVIAAGPGVGELLNRDDGARRRILAQLSEVAVDCLLIDTGAGVGETVLSLVQDADEARRTYDCLSEILVRLLAYRPGYAGHVPTDPQVMQAATEQVPFLVNAPGCPASLAVSALAAEMLGSRAALCERVAAPLQAPMSPREAQP